MLAYSREGEIIPDFTSYRYSPRLPSPPRYIGRDSARMSSSLSSSSTGHSPKENLRVHFQNSEGEVEWDSGVEENGELSPSNRYQYRPTSPINSIPITLSYLDQCSSDYVLRLRTLIGHIDFFRQLANRETNASDDLLQDMKYKLKPRLLILDEDVSRIVDEIKINIDRCRITDQRLNGLLIYNEYLTEIHSILEKLMTKILDELEKHLRILDRGASGVPNRHYVIQRTLTDIGKNAQQLEIKIRDEGIRRQRHSPTTTSRTSSSGSRSK